MKNIIYLTAGLAMATTIGAIAAAPIKEVFIANTDLEAVPVTVVGGQPGGVAPVYEFVGFSDVAVLGYAPMLERQQACQAKFGPMARWATSEEWFTSQSPVAPDPGVAEGAWIRPSVMTGSGNGTDAFYGVCGVPGVSLNQAMVDSQFGNIRGRSCNTTTVLPVACSAPGS